MFRGGFYPTPVTHLEALGLWVKRDDLTHPVYGGNKVRKLDRLIPYALEHGKKRILTVGAAGSHHVLATGVHAKSAGLSVAAAVVPQPRTAHVEENLRADLGLGVTLHPARTYAGAFVSMLAHTRPGTYLVPMGGSNVVGSLGYVDAAFELAGQIKAGELPEPEVIVVTVGSGGTAAGIVAGLALAGLKTQVVGVVVASPVWFVRYWTGRLVRAVYAHAGGRTRSDIDGRLELVTTQLGSGYGHPTDAGRRAMTLAGEHGLVLDLTYTAKCFAGALDVVASKRFEHVLYWHTLSSAPMSPLLEGAPPLPDKLTRLFS
jgi:1-aminocyclopropane-1-carboxylate deaminase/D-cysteine desulfhydrase-like pyridoxal-dependent ACC family enzyme